MSDKPEPTAEHIDARLGRVSQAMIDTATNRGLSPATRSALLALSREIDAVLMTMRRDHAALAANLPTDAMLTALVERGALTEQEVDAPRWHDTGEPIPTSTENDEARHLRALEAGVIEHRCNCADPPTARLVACPIHGLPRHNEPTP